MRYFFSSWRDSLSLFIPKNAKLFSLVTLKAILNTYKIAGKNLWWLAAIALISEIAYYRFFLQTAFALVPLILWFLFVFMLYLSVRPSLHKKDSSYYVGYLPYFFYFVILCFLAGMIPFYFRYMSKVIADLALNSSPWYAFLYVPFLYVPLPFAFAVPDVVPVYAMPLFSFWTLFLLDSRGRIRDIFLSLWRALKLMIYNYPFCLIAYTLIVGLSYAFKWTIFMILGRYTLFITLAESLFAVIPLSVYTMFYTKRLHEQFTLYFPESIKE